jgi:pyridoxamine 5'-phosphate oxidase family protein
MSALPDAGRAYLDSQRLGGWRDGMPHVVPAGFRDNPQHNTIGIGGHDFATRKKYRDVDHPKVALVVDDIASVSPWRVRGVEMRGEVQVLETGGTELGPRFAPQMFRITPGA